ncbi:MAG: hypothetical protein V5804_07245 [Mucilaginibacter sp.]|uniref:hypothetical protein n=1 Tax=Mucilaginibacter sp. TaxID=1882438 RepID=UPI0034E3C0E7
MGKQYQSVRFLVAVFFFVSRASARYRVKFKRSPVKTVELIANKLVSTTIFRYQLTQQKAFEAFDGIKFIHFSRTYGIGKAGIAYALTNIESIEDGNVTLQVRHSDGLKIWVNDKVAYQKVNIGNAIVNY